MPVSPYGGMIFAALAAVGALESPAQAPDTASAPAEIVLAADQTIVVDEIRAICARRDAEVITASADPATGSSLHLALVDGGGNFISGAPITIAGRSLKGPPMRLRCRGDWLLLHVEPGDYTVKAEVDGLVRSRAIEVPDYGRVRVALSVRDTRRAEAS